MSQALIKSFGEAKDIILEPICTGNDDVDQMALIEATADFGCLIETTINMLENNNKITAVLRNNFEHALNKRYECPLQLEYQQRFTEKVTPLLKRTNVCALKEF